MNFKEILNQFHIPIAPTGHHHVGRGWIQFDCPFCGRDTHKWHIGYSPEGNFCNCWRCGVHSVYSVLNECTNNQHHREIYLYLQQLEHDRPKPKEPIKGMLATPVCVDHKYFHAAHKRYLKSRNFNTDEIKKLWQIKTIALAARLKWRIWIPVYYQTKLVTWTTRSIGEKSQGPRYISAKPEHESIPLKHLLYGEDYCRHGIIIHEGPTDVWRTGPGAVATFGVSVSSEQILKIIQHPIRAICFDSDKDAQKRARTLADKLSIYPGETLNVELDKGDPATMNEKQVKQLRKKILE